MNKSTASRTIHPLLLLAIVPVTLGALFLLYRSFSSEERPKLPAPVTRYRLISERAGLSPVSGVPVSTVTYEMEVPSDVQAFNVEVSLVDEGGKRLWLTRLASTPVTHTFGVRGYRKALRSPRLVIERDGAVVFEQPVGTLPEPARTMPLVVPVDSQWTLRNVDHKQVKGYERYRFGRRAHIFEFVGAPLDPRRTTVSFIRTDWQVIGGSPLAFANGRWIVVTADAHPGDLAEVRFTHAAVNETSREVEVWVELFEEKGQPGLRVLKPARVTFEDGATVSFPVHERKPAPGNRPRLLRNLSMKVETMHSTLLTSPSHTDIPAFRESMPEQQLSVEPLFPLEDLGLRQLHLGIVQHQARVEPRGPIRYGKHRLRFRVRHVVKSLAVEQRTIRFQHPDKQP